VSGQSDVLEVWLDCDLGPGCLVGTLAHDRGRIRFRYERSWLTDSRAFSLDPDLSLDDAPFFPKPDMGNFARPKANFAEADGSLWIGKFPSRDDDRDIGAWEQVVHGLAKKAGIDVPAARLVRLNNDFHTFCVQRFDRVKGSRRFYASAMTLLRKEQSEGTSYLELAQFLRANGDGAQVAPDLEQLFRRVAFNVAVGNRDDHLHNHGFVLGATGWRLAPAFDVNPNIDKVDHVSNIDDTDSRPSLANVLDTAFFLRTRAGTRQASSRRGGARR